MSTKKTAPKTVEVKPKATVKKEPKAPIVKKTVKAPKFKLITYTVKAVIPTGMYANIQPEITVQATSIENAERAVMPHIESLFAKYREGGPQGAQPVVARPTAPVASAAPAPAAKPVAPAVPVAPAAPKAPVSTSPLAPIAPPVAPAPAPAPTAPVAPVSSPIVMTLPFTRAKSAIESCMSSEALKLVSDQVEKSTKLIDSEKAELRTLAESKAKELTK